MKFLNILNIVLQLLFLIMLIGCESMESRWQDAQSKNTVEAYENFIKDYPESPFDKEAKGKIIELQFESAKEKNTILAYEEFIEKYPESPYVEQAILNRKQLYFQDANQQNTIEVYEEFIQRYPTSAEAEEAKSKIMKLIYDEVKQSNTVQDYEKFVKHYPKSSYAKQAQNEILNFYANKLRASKTLEAKESIEDIIISKISKNGVGTRFKITSILPEKDGHTGSIAVEQIGASSALVNLKTLYPKDKLEFAFTLSGMNPLKPLGNKSVWRFLGEIEFMGYTFIGDKDEPLTFILLKNAGFVYLHGKGTIKKNGRHIATLP